LFVQEDGKTKKRYGQKIFEKILGKAHHNRKYTFNEMIGGSIKFPP